MSTLAQKVAFCKSQAAYHLRKAAEPNIQAYIARKHKEAAAGLTDLMDFLVSLPAHIADPPTPEASAALFDLDPFRLDDVPDEVVEELKISRADKADAEVLELFRLANRPLTISEVLIGLFRRFKVADKRAAVNARLYRLAQSGLLEPSDERGVYRLPTEGGTRESPQG